MYKIFVDTMEKSVFMNKWKATLHRVLVVMLTQFYLFGETRVSSEKWLI